MGAEIEFRLTRDGIFSLSEVWQPDERNTLATKMDYSDRISGKKDEFNAM